MERKKLLVRIFIIAVTLLVGLKVYGEQANIIEITFSGKTVKLYSPITIENVLSYYDGGTTGFITKDSKGTKFSFCLDGRMHQPNPRHIFIGSNYPTGPVAVEVPIGGAQEKIILKILEDWLRANVSQEQQVKLSNWNNVATTQEEGTIKSVLRVIGELKNR